MFAFHLPQKLTLQLFCLLVFGLVAIAAGPSSASESTSLELRISNIKSLEGSMAIAIFAEGLSFQKLRGPTGKKLIEVEEYEIVTTFDDIPAGTYAITIFQDLNKNGNLDKNFFGNPKEPYGFSNGAKKPFGLRGFSHLNIEIQPGANSYDIELLH